MQGIACLPNLAAGWCNLALTRCPSPAGISVRRFDCTEDTLVRLAASLYYRISRSRPHTGSAVIAGGLLLYPGSRQSLYSHVW